MSILEFSAILGNFGEFFGAIAVVATLIYLSVQIRQNSKLSRAATRQAIADASQRNALANASSTDISALIISANKGEELAEDEALRLRSFFYASYKSSENIYYQYRKGLFDEEEWEASRRNTNYILRQPANRLWFEEYGRKLLSRPFCRNG